MVQKKDDIVRALTEAGIKIDSEASTAKLQSIYDEIIYQLPRNDKLKFGDFDSAMGTVATNRTVQQQTREPHGQEQQQQQEIRWSDMVETDEIDIQRAKESFELELPSAQFICRAIDLDLETRIAEKKLRLKQMQSELNEINRQIEAEAILNANRMVQSNSVSNESRRGDESDAVANVCENRRSGQVDLSEVRCYNCFEYGHYNSSCLKPRRPKNSCFMCHQVGHTRHSCPQKKKKENDAQMWLWSKGTAATTNADETSLTVENDTSKVNATATVNTSETEAKSFESEANEFEVSPQSQTDEIVDEESMAKYKAAYEAAEIRYKQQMKEMYGDNIIFV